MYHISEFSFADKMFFRLKHLCFYFFLQTIFIWFLLEQMEKLWDCIFVPSLICNANFNMTWANTFLIIIWIFFHRSPYNLVENFVDYGNDNITWYFCTECKYYIWKYQTFMRLSDTYLPPIYMILENIIIENQESGIKIVNLFRKMKPFLLF